MYRDRSEFVSNLVHLGPFTSADFGGILKIILKKLCYFNALDKLLESLLVHQKILLHKINKLIAKKTIYFVVRKNSQYLCTNCDSR